MRPIRKFSVGETTPSGHTVLPEYNPYQTAKPFLIENIGRVCAYCEVSIPYDRMLDVEHILPKKHFPKDEFKWDNFLLSCPTCNRSKLDKIIDFGTTLFPTIDDTFNAYKYPFGVMKVNTYLPNADQDKAKNLMALIGLDKVSANHDINRRRRETFNIATRRLKEFQNKETTLPNILDNAKATGFWSVWMDIFQSYPAVTQELIREFSGTRL